MTTEKDVLIIGAGPFGLAVAAQAVHTGIKHLIVGKPMEFWRRHMPKGMYLRSACDWHLDPLNKVNVARLPVLASGNILSKLNTRNGFPELDDHFESSIPGLFITSMPATQDFGPFFGFTIAVRAAAELICERLRHTRAGRS